MAQQTNSELAQGDRVQNGFYGTGRVVETHEDGSVCVKWDEGEDHYGTMYPEDLEVQG